MRGLGEAGVSLLDLAALAVNNPMLQESIRLQITDPERQRLETFWGKAETDLGQVGHLLGTLAGGSVGPGEIGRLATLARGAERITLENMAREITSAGGVTMNLRSGTRPAVGYAVARPGTVQLVDEVTPTVLRDFMREHRVALESPTAHLGAWKNPETGQWEMNLTDVHPDLPTALQEGHARGEQSVGDLAAYAAGREGAIPVQAPLQLEHRSPAELGGMVRPSAGGTGPVKGAERARQQAFPEHFVPRSYFSVAGSPVESGFEHLPVHRGQLQHVYDIKKDPLGTLAQAEAEATRLGVAGPAVASLQEKIIRDAGYQGYQRGSAVAAFQDTPVTAVDPLDAPAYLRNTNRPINTVHARIADEAYQRAIQASERFNRRARGPYVQPPKALLPAPVPPKQLTAPVPPKQLMPPTSEGNRLIRQVAAEYGQTAGLPEFPLSTIAKEHVSEPGRRMAQVYKNLTSNPHDPAVREAYQAFTQETAAQGQAIRQAGITPEFVTQDPYRNSAEMMADVRRGRIKILSTPEGGHPLLTPQQNDEFRFVHDVMGHAREGHQFGPLGEERAYRTHAPMYSPLARRAMATETRGQNSWVNFTPGHEQLAPTARPFAEQKAALWPEEYTGGYEAFPPQPNAAPAILPSLGLDWRRGIPNIAEMEKRLPSETPAGILTSVAPGSLTRRAQIDLSAVPQAKRVQAWHAHLADLERAFRNPLWEQDVRRGVGLRGHLWYPSDQILASAIQALGPEQGRAAFEEWAQLMGPTSLQTSPPQNLRNAGYRYVIAPETATADLGRQGPPGFRALYPTLQGEVLANLRRSGALDPFKYPKISRYSENIMGNWQPATLDVHEARRLGQLGSQMTPDPTAYYGPAESLYQTRAEEMMNEGFLPVPAGMSPTAAAQSARWVGGADATGVRGGAASASRSLADLFARSIFRTHVATGQTPEEVARLFWTRQQPLF